MIDLYPPVSNIATFILGYFTCRAVTIWEARRMQQTAGTSPTQPRRGRVVVTALVIAFLLLAGFGIQQGQFQKAQDSHDRCQERWGQQVVDTLQARSSVSRDVADAQAAKDTAQSQKDEASDRVFLIVAAAQRHISSAEQKQARHDFRAALRDFVIAKRTLDAAKIALDSARAKSINTQAANPYPRLHCR
jgi:hypothetical protein